MSENSIQDGAFEEEDDYEEDDTPEGDLYGSLGLAVEQSKVQKVVNLLKQGANPNYKSKQSPPVLLTVAWSGNVNILNLLLDAGADVNMRDHHQNALHRACYFYNLEVVKALIEHGIELNEINSAGQSALHIAASCGFESAIRVLIEEKADPFLTDQQGHQAIECVGEPPLTRGFDDATERKKIKENCYGLLSAYMQTLELEKISHHGLVNEGKSKAPKL